MTADAGVPITLRHYKQTGQWMNYLMAAFHSTALKLNATYEPITIYSPPLSRIKLNGTWDPYVEYLINRKAHIGTVRGPQADPEKVIYYSIPSFFDAIVFISATPRDLGSADIFTGDTMSIAFIGGALFFATFSAFFIILAEQWVEKLFRKELHLSFNFREIAELLVSIFLDSLKTIFDQSLHQFGGRTLRFLRPSGNLFFMWLLSVMLISNMFKCNFVSNIVSPNPEYMPSTFEELIESNFKLKSIFLKVNGEASYIGLRNGINDVVLERAEDCPNFMDPKCCYQSILRWNAACVGHKLIMEDVAYIFLVDVNGNKLFKTTTDIQLSMAATNTVSKYFPEVLETLNFVLTMQMNCGLQKHYLDRRKRVVKAQGKGYAKRVDPSSEFYPIYSGVYIQDTTGEKLIKFLLLLLFVPAGISIMCFLAEKLSISYSTRSSVIELNYIT
ncbi:unnamed protein product [Orchesella dallaii]|uniref:Uncharacterized protein n=1 Tax=Orchesella dallaii TaxID=48710 RepID=A0ABP1R6I1_9HEXA